MTRHAIALVFVFVMIPGALAAQTTLTIEATSTDVHDSPKVGARVVGQAHRGRVLDVTHQDGDWVTVVWPEAAAQVGYVRLKVGVLENTDDSSTPVSDARADVDAVERAIFAFWAERFDTTTALLDEAQR